MKVWFAVITIGIAGCSPAIDPPGCVDEEPERLGTACNGDGECGSWLVCDGACALPESVLGEGGSSARIVTDDDVIELRVEVARSDLARTRGLANRPCIADGWGLILEYPTEGDHLITTRLMRFDLDIAMAGADGVIHTVHRDVAAGSEALLGSDAPVAAVLEVRAATFPIAAGNQLQYD